MPPEIEEVYGSPCDARAGKGLAGSLMEISNTIASFLHLRRVEKGLSANTVSGIAATC